jgi:hypothetical protein
MPIESVTGRRTRGSRGPVARQPLAVSVSCGMSIANERLKRRCRAVAKRLLARFRADGRTYATAMLVDKRISDFYVREEVRHRTSQAQIKRSEHYCGLIEVKCAVIAPLIEGAAARRGLEAPSPQAIAEGWEDCERFLSEVAGEQPLRVFERDRAWRAKYALAD